ncbi:hypothetical protein [Bacillus altitudinis]|uniref:hypothetical protein n=1 Tax=Bacillus altitudinis TaxID=293387 RepID=UPI0011A38DB8|nr:hypothetical protein [Bacillus altitudinis]
MVRLEVNITFRNGRKWIDDQHYVDMSCPTTKWTTTLNFSAWKKGDAASIGFYDRTYFSCQRIFPHKVAYWIAKRQLRSHVRNFNRELKKRGHDITLEMKV